MQTRTLYLVGVLFSVIFVVSAGHGKGDKKKWMEKMKKCGDGEMNTEEVFKGTEECKTEAKSEAGSRRRRSPNEDGDGKKKMGGKWMKNMCMAVCTWKKQGVLDDSGKFSESGAKAFVDRAYPEAARTDAYEKMKACADENSSTFSMDDNCAGYKKFKKCTFGAHMKACGIEWGKGKGKGDKPQGPPPDEEEE